jgi:hypothetical protein
MRQYPPHAAGFPRQARMPYQINEALRFLWIVQGEKALTHDEPRTPVISISLQMRGGVRPFEDA